MRLIHRDSYTITPDPSRTSSCMLWYYFCGTAESPKDFSSSHLLSEVTCLMCLAGQGKKVRI